uniref:Uncharacterized protein n=1 Tax=Arundo donax TaxID=35708 RepID=A0A0A9FUX8_ARUDO
MHGNKTIANCHRFILYEVQLYFQ